MRYVHLLRLSVCRCLTWLKASNYPTLVLTFSLFVFPPWRSVLRPTPTSACPQIPRKLPNPLENGKIKRHIAAFHASNQNRLRGMSYRRTNWHRNQFYARHTHISNIHYHNDIIIMTLNYLSWGVLFLRENQSPPSPGRNRYPIYPRWNSIQTCLTWRIVVIVVVGLFCWYYCVFLIIQLLHTFHKITHGIY